MRLAPPHGSDGAGIEFHLPHVQRLGRRIHIVLIATVTAGAVAAWAAMAVLVRGMDSAIGGPPNGPLVFCGLWALMIVGMMVPSSAPMLATDAALRRAVGGVGDLLAGTGSFAAGYVLAWCGAGMLAYAAHAVAGGGSLWEGGNRYVAGALVLVAAAYQLTPAKDRCLARCRVPLAFMLSSWRDGPAGALWMGLRFGAWCIGCCWALMAALLALGLMSFSWMAVIGSLIALEKLAPARTASLRAVALALFALALALLA
jgi:predicted metal-binding membrane protein